MEHFSATAVHKGSDFTVSGRTALDDKGPMVSFALQRPPPINPFGLRPLTFGDVRFHSLAAPTFSKCPRNCSWAVSALSTPSPPLPLHTLSPPPLPPPSVLTPQARPTCSPGC